MSLSRYALTITAIAVTGCAAAVATEPPSIAPIAPVAVVSEPQLISAANIVEARKSAFGLSAAAFHHMRTRIDAGTDVTPLAFSARRLERWAKVLPAMFPPGTGPGTRAKPEVWTNRADFEAKAADYVVAAGKLAELAEANDKGAFAAQWKAVDATCAACHKTYRAEQ